MMLRNPRSSTIPLTFLIALLTNFGSLGTGRSLALTTSQLPVYDAIATASGEATQPPSDQTPGIPAWLLLLPAAGVGVGVAWWLKGRQSTTSDTTLTPAVPSPAPVDESSPPIEGSLPEKGPSLAERAGAIISSDRQSIAGIHSASPDSPATPVVEELPPPSSNDAIPPVQQEPPILPPPSTVTTAGMTGGAALAAGLGTAAMTSVSGDRDQSNIEAAKFDVGQSDLSSEALALVDVGLPGLPEGYGDSRIVLLPRDPQCAYAYWDVTSEHKENLRRQGGQRLALRFCDVTDIDLTVQKPHSLQQYDCEEFAQDWYIPVPVSDRDYIVEIGYLTADGHWLLLARSAPMRVPPVYPSDWFEEQFITVSWDEDLRGKTLVTLIPPAQQAPIPSNPIYDEIFDMVQSADVQRLAGSIYGSMQMVPEEIMSSYGFPSGVGMGSLPTASMSGIGMSGIGFSASITPIRPRRFWLLADAELIVYGATEPDATVTIGGQPIPLRADGTFRFQMSFQDGNIDYPIRAIAADGEQNRSIHMQFNRETPKRHINTKEDATDEWLPGS